VEFPGFSRCSNPGLQLANAFGVLANAFGVNFKLRHYLFVATLDLRPADALKIENAFLERAEG